MSKKSADKSKDLDIEAIRHSASHILAQAVLEMFPEAKLAIGPSIENGFYYDFDLPRTLIPEDLPILEKKMKHIIKQNQKFERYEEPIDKGIEYLKTTKQDYKVEMAEDLKAEGEKTISFYKNIQPQTGEGTFVDMCAGPHVEHSGQVKAFKLTKIAGAYWKGDEKNKMLQRIYGVAFNTKEELDQHLKNLKEAEKRDHRKIGKELELFWVDSRVGAGLPMWLPKGAILWRMIEDFWYREHLKGGYDLVRSPHIGSRQLWETSGHWSFYKDDMYSPIQIDDEEYLLKPMNCPFHVTLYQAKKHSYRDFPLRWAESATVYRYEQSGELSGLTRVRGFTQDDAHIICRKDQVKEELLRVAKFIVYIFKTFGFEDYKIYLSLRDPKDKKKYAGHDKGWEFTEKVLEEVADEMKFDYVKEEGEAAFYGPKLDFKIKDVLGREWQCSTLQFDFNLPERFDMTYVNEDGEEERPYMLHRALFGSYERFIGLLIEHYAGAFPAWLAPVQVKVIPVAEPHNQYAKQVQSQLENEGIRVEFDESGDSLNKKIRNAEMQKVPYMLILGNKESESNSVASRSYKTKKQEVMETDKFIDMLKKEIEERV